MGTNLTPKQILGDRYVHKTSFLGFELYSFDDSDLVSLDQSHPAHKVYIKGFYISKYEVTVDLFKKYLEETKLEALGKKENITWGKHQGNYPVNHISYNDALEFCRWLSDKTGIGYRLPTEAEWEKAAQGGKKNIFPWGNSLDKMPKGLRCGPVGSYPPNPYGIYDMEANVAEFCSTDYAPYPNSDYTLKSWERGNKKVAKGGFPYVDSMTEVLYMCAYRQAVSPEERYWYCGFRLAADSLKADSINKETGKQPPHSS